MRVAFSIILNGLHHLAHNDYYNQMCQMFDHWVIVEGVANNGGSTSWCNNLNSKFHNNFLSNDGTTEFLNKNKKPNVTVIRPQEGGPWPSKDDQVNAAINHIQTLTSKCFLWQIDIDEQWTVEQLQAAEDLLTKSGGKTGCFLCNFYVGPGLIVKGDWGEGRYLPYRRLWNWCGEKFKSHEPPQLDGKNGPGLLLPQRFNHYAYYFEQDILFKEHYYSGYQGLHDRWQTLQSEKFETKHINALLGSNTWWGNTNTYIHYVG